MFACETPTTFHGTRLKLRGGHANEVWQKTFLLFDSVFISFGRAGELIPLSTSHGAVLFLLAKRLLMSIDLRLSIWSVHNLLDLMPFQVNVFGSWDNWSNPILLRPAGVESAGALEAVFSLPPGRCVLLKQSKAAVPLSRAERQCLNCLC
jgi:hypothetical protein